MKLNRAELAAVLTGLRLLQRTDSLPMDLYPIYTDGDQFAPLDNDGIDALCERINTAGVIE